jgi:autotransporter-associated beta strand protein
MKSTTLVHSALRSLAVVLATSSVCQAASFTLVRKDALGASSFNAGTNWNVAAAPAPGNIYSSNGYSLRTPPNNAAHVFAGDSLTVPAATDGDSGIIFKGTAGSLITIPNLILSGGRGLGNGNAPVTQTLDGNITVTADTTIDCGSNAIFHLSADFISGTGGLSMANASAATTLSTLRLSGNNTGWTGKLAATLADPAKRFVIETSSETHLGGNPPALTADQLTLGSATLRPLASFTIDDPNRGIRLDPNGGTFETTTGIELGIATPISGPGALEKTGPGTLVLSATNTHTGHTLVTAGTLSLSGTIATSPSITIAAGSTLDVLPRANDTLAVAAGQTLQGAGTVVGNVAMSSTASFSYQTAAGAGTEAALLVQGDLTLDGNLQLTGLESLPDGIHTFPLIRYTGNLTNLGLDTSSLPATFIGSIVIDSSNKQVNLTGTKSGNTWLPTVTPLNSRATITWPAIAGAASYNVKRSTSPAGSFVTVNKVTTSPYTDAPLLNGTTYYYQISAVASGVEAATSNTVSVTPAITTGTPAMMFGDSVRLKRPFAKDPTVVRFGGRYLMYYSQKNTSNQWSAGIAESTDLVNWTRVGEFLPGGGGPDNNGLAAPCGRVINGKVELFYQSYIGAPSDRLCNATSADGLNFTRNPANPIFGPSGSGVWNNGRAIDADYIEYNGRMLLSCATRDTTNTVQQVVVADAPIGPDYSSSVWTMLTPTAATFPPIQSSWEQKCIEGQTMCVRNNKLFMFYGGAYNNAPQQIGVASSTDGANWTRLPSLGGIPFFPDGAAGTWNSSESGHPGIFIDEDDQTYMFYQGNNDNGNTWFLSVLKIGWNGDVPFIKPGIAPIADLSVPIGMPTSVNVPIMFPVPDADTLTLTATSSNPALIPNNHLVFTGTGCGRNLSATPAPATAGVATLSLVATDPAGNSDTSTYQITVGDSVEIWNQQWFGTPFALGNAALNADPDHDGEPNLLELATGQNPTDGTRALVTLVLTPGATLDFNYHHSKAAIAAGITCSAEWSDDLTAGSWSDAGVIQQSSSLDMGETFRISARIPIGTSNARFVRLRIHGNP